MKNRTFCVLLAATLMLLGGLTGALMKERESAEEDVQDATVHAYVQEALGMAEIGTVIEAFGAQYSEELGQWTMVDTMTLAMDAAEEMYMPADGVILSIEAMADGGSCVTIDSSGTLLKLFPLYGIRVFPGSEVRQGSVLGTVREKVSVYAEKDGLAVDPASLLPMRRMENAGKFSAETGAAAAGVE